MWDARVCRSWHDACHDVHRCLRGNAGAHLRTAHGGAVASGAVPKWLMFWGHQPQVDGSVGEGRLSQWWACRFTVDEVEYVSAEHWMMASKARMFGDLDAVASILAARTSAEAKNLGWLVRGFDERAWAQRRFELVVEGNVAKFGHWRGLNLLGFALMEARERLAAR